MQFNCDHSSSLKEVRGCIRLGDASFENDLISPAHLEISNGQDLKHPIDSCGHVDSPQTIDEDQTVDIKQRFFFKRDMEKFEHFFVERIEAN